MTNNNTYSISEIHVIPYSSETELDRNPDSMLPFADSNVERCDFLSFKSTKALAVGLKIVNESNITLYRRAKESPIDIVIVDTTAADTIVAAKTCQKIIFYSDTATAYARINVPIDTTVIVVDHEYELRVLDGVTGDIVSYKKLHFYPMHDLRQLPTKWYRPVNAYVNPASPWGIRAMRSPGKRSGNVISLRYRLLNLLPQDVHILPEVEVVLYDAEGNRMSRWVRPEVKEPDFDWESSRSESVVAEASFFVESDKSGIYYSELRSMNYAFTGFVFSTLDTDAEDGMWKAEEMACMSEYSTELCRIRFYNLKNSDCTKSEECKAHEPAVADAESDVATDVSADNEIGDVYVDRCAKVDDEGVYYTESMLDDMVGLEKVKEKLSSYARVMRFNKLREDAGFPVLRRPHHAMFLGSPGTGKTTVAKIMGGMMRDMGVLSRGHVVVRERATLCGQFYNSEAEKTLDALKEAEGGILFIDEAYQLYRAEDLRDPGRLVLETLMTALADESRNDWMLILAGYTEPMMRLFEINPGLKSRIPESNFYRFEDFFEEQLMEIAVGLLTKNQFVLSDAAYDALKRHLAVDYRQRDKEFGNARHVVNLITTQIIPAMAARICEYEAPTAEQLKVIEVQDIPVTIFSPVCRSRRIGYAV